MTEAATATASATDSGAGTGETTAATTETTATETGATTLLGNGADATATDGEAKPAENGADADAGTDDAAVLAAKKAAKKDEPKGETKEAKASDDKPKADAKTDEPKAEEAKPSGLPEDFDWRDLLTDPKNKERSSNFNSPDDLVEWVREADQKLRNAIFVPGKDSTDEEWAKYRKRIGVPADYTGYKIEVGEGADEGDISRIDRLKKVAHANNWTPAILASALDFYSQETAAIAAQEDERHAQHMIDAQTGLSRKWGGDYSRNMGLAHAAYVRAFGERHKEMEDVKLADGTKLLNDPRMCEAFARVGRWIGEAGIPGQVMPDSWEPDEAELIKWQSEPGYYNGTDPALVAKVTEGYKRLHSKR